MAKPTRRPQKQIYKQINHHEIVHEGTQFH